MHIASLFCQQFAPVLPDGRSWDDEREKAADLIIDTVTKHAPNFKGAVIARQIHSPLDLERKFGLIDGDIMHGHMSLDQLWAARPVLGHGDYRSPIKGLYMCGAGTHPGGGVTGAPGHNAAHEILADRSVLGRLFRQARLSSGWRSGARRSGAGRRLGALEPEGPDRQAAEHRHRQSGQGEQQADRRGPPTLAAWSG